METIQTYTHREAAELNATRFVTLGDFNRLRDAARAVVEAYEHEGLRLIAVEPAIRALETEAAKVTV